MLCKACSRLVPDRGSSSTKQYLPIWMTITGWTAAVPARKGCAMRSWGLHKGCVCSRGGLRKLPSLSCSWSQIQHSAPNPVSAALQAPGWVEHKALGFVPALQWGAAVVRAVRTARLAEAAAQNVGLLHIHQGAEIFEWLLWCLFAVCLNKYPICKICSNGAWKWDVQRHVL